MLRTDGIKIAEHCWREGKRITQECDETGQRVPDLREYAHRGISALALNFTPAANRLARMLYSLMERRD